MINIKQDLTKATDADIAMLEMSMPDGIMDLTMFDKSVSLDELQSFALAVSEQGAKRKEKYLDPQPTTDEEKKFVPIDINQRFTKLVDLDEQALQKLGEVKNMSLHDLHVFDKELTVRDLYFWLLARDREIVKRFKVAQEEL